MGAPSNPYKPPDEIELLDLIVSATIIVEKHFRIILTIVGSGIACSLGLYMMQTDQYETVLFAEIPSIPPHEVEHIFHSINQNIQSGNTSELELEYGFLPRTTNLLKEIRLVATDQTPNYRIETIGYSKNYGPDLASQLSGLLSSRNEIASRQEKAVLKRRIALLSTEIEKLEQMPLHEGSNTFPGALDTNNPGSHLNWKLGIVKERLDLELKFEQLNNDVLVHCSQRSGTLRANAITTYLFTGIVCSVFIGFMVAALREIIVAVRNRRQTNARSRPIGIHKTFNYN